VNHISEGNQKIEVNQDIKDNYVTKVNQLVKDIQRH